MAAGYCGAQSSLGMKREGKLLQAREAVSAKGQRPNTTWGTARGETGRGSTLSDPQKGALKFMLRAVAAADCFK